jgi:hypothetical protein
MFGIKKGENMTEREALQIALQALETSMYPQQKQLQAITAIKEALAQPEQEPKCGAIIEVFGKDWRLEYLSLPVGKHKLYTQQYTYTTPPQRKPLTDEEIQYALESEFLSSDERRNWQDDLRVARAIEAAHGITGEKNGTR